MTAALAALVPMKGIAGAKSRLSPILDQLSREALCLALLAHVLESLAASGVCASTTVVLRE